MFMPGRPADLLLHVKFSVVDGPYGWLNNMSKHWVTIKGVTYRSAEAAFQSTRFEDEVVKEAIRIEKSPVAAKMVAQNNASRMTVGPRSAEDLQNMEMILRLKMEQHDRLVPKLLKTKGRTILEDVSKRPRTISNDFWGQRRDIDTHWQWVGRNMLGTIWMRIRDTIEG